MAITDEQAELSRLSDELYAKHVRPLENQHRGEYIAVSPLGKTVLAPTLIAVMERAETDLGDGNFVFRVGSVAVGRWL